MPVLRFGRRDCYPKRICKSICSAFKVYAIVCVGIRYGKYTTRKRLQSEKMLRSLEKQGQVPWTRTCTDLEDTEKKKTLNNERNLSENVHSLGTFSFIDTPRNCFSSPIYKPSMSKTIPVYQQFWQQNRKQGTTGASTHSMAHYSRLASG